MQSIIVVSLAYDIPTVHFFAITYAVLLLVNAAYLTWSVSVSHKAITNIENEVFPEWQSGGEKSDNKNENLPNNAAIKWAENNFLHSCLIFVLIAIFYDSPFFPVVFILCSTNTAIDFILTRNFYFPKFLKKYQMLPKDV